MAVFVVYLNFTLNFFFNFNNCSTRDFDLLVLQLVVMYEPNTVFRVPPYTVDVRIPSLTSPIVPEWISSAPVWIYRYNRVFYWTRRFCLRTNNTTSVFLTDYNNSRSLICVRGRPKDENHRGGGVDRTAKRDTWVWVYTLGRPHFFALTIVNFVR